MPFDHNDHYHRLLLRRVPPGARTALDVGCGTGRLARRLAARGLDVEAGDVSAPVLRAAEATGGGVRYRRLDLAEDPLPTARYDVVTALAVVHHLDFAVVARLRAALAPGGVLLILGCYPTRTPVDHAWSAVAVPVNAAARAAVATGEAAAAVLRGGRRPSPPAPPVREPGLPLPELRRAAAELLPGCRLRRLLFWRYLLEYRNPESTAGVSPSS